MALPLIRTRLRVPVDKAPQLPSPHFARLSVEEGPEEEGHGGC